MTIGFYGLKDTKLSVRNIFLAQFVDIRIISTMSLVMDLCLMKAKGTGELLKL